MAVISPVVACNRKQIDNGRTYLREMVFGDPAEPHHREALSLTVRTENAVAAVLQRDRRIDPETASTLAHIVSAVMFISMAATVNIGHSVDEIIADIRHQIQALLPR
jgi:hypothetical protein